MSEKKSIYNLNIKEMRKLLKEFSDTLYGRTIFFLAYFIPMITFLVLIGLIISELIDPKYDLFCPIVCTFLLFIASFILGNIYYYHELRIFSEEK